MIFVLYNDVIPAGMSLRLASLSVYRQTNPACSGLAGNYEKADIVIQE